MYFPREIWEMIFKYKKENFEKRIKDCIDGCTWIKWRRCDVPYTAGIFRYYCKVWCRGRPYGEYTCKQHKTRNIYITCKCGKKTRVYK